MKRTVLYQKALNAYGITAQDLVAVEEMTELSKVILKSKRGEMNTQELIDEISDVEIMLEQLKQNYNVAEQVKARKRYKKKRLEKRVIKKDEFADTYQTWKEVNLTT
jgi:hypothetical protein